MDFGDPHQRHVFFDVHRDLPREAPGSRDCTVQALACIRAALPEEPRVVVDVGCGPGGQTLDLAGELPGARFVAVDLHVDFLRDLALRAVRAGVGARIRPVQGDMRRLPVAPGRADLIWCEGAAYVMGVAAALRAWWNLLRPGAACAFTEAVWLRADPPAEARELWASYPGMGGVEAVRKLVGQAGYELLGDFVLPAEAWWDDYYGPMEARLARLDRAYRDDPVAGAVLDECRREIDVYRRCGASYGYAFFMAFKQEG